MGVGIGKFLIDLGVINIFDTKITCSGSMLASGWLLFRYITITF